MGDKRNDERDYFIALYQGTKNDIEFMKRQQWTITYYGLILYGVLISLKHMIIPVNNGLSCFEKGAFLSIAVVICVLCIIALVIFQISLNKYRVLIQRLEKEFPIKTKNIISEHISSNVSVGNFYILIVQLFALVSGVFAVAWLFYK